MSQTIRHPRSDAPTVIMHWLLVLALAVSLTSGLRISADDTEAGVSRWLEPVLMQGDVTRWHVVSAFSLAALALGYWLFLWRARLASRVKPTLSLAGAASRETRWYTINRVLYWIAFGLILTAMVTGGVFYFLPGQLSERTVASIHRIAAWGVLGYVVLHVAAQLALGGVRQLLKILSPRVAYGGAGALAAGASLAAVGGVVYVLNDAMIRSLPVLHAAEAPTIDGLPDEPVWAKATPLEIPTVRGANLPGGEVKVRVRALQDGQRAYLLFEWPDSTRSQKHLPLMKTASGWRVMENKYAVHDEDDYYEDKFGVMLSRSPQLAGGGATHLGPKPIADKPGSPNGRGLHYTADGEVVDVWHWKSVRSGPLGQIDDNYFGPPMPATDKPGARYTGGYTQDPKTGGGFEQNWKQIEGSAFVEPRRLPKDHAALAARMGGVDLDPNQGDPGEWWMALGDTVPYSREIDTLPVGTVIPSVLIDRPFEGDRGDIRARGTWRDGWWRLEVSRQLDTGSRFDLPIANDIYLWVSVFDHTQTRHSRHLHPVRLVME
jgi:hypothetical protein